MKAILSNLPVNCANAAETAAATVLCAILGVVLLQVAFNLTDSLLPVFGWQPPGLIVPSYSEISGFLLAAATFLALASTFLSDGHIRVRLFTDRLAPRRRKQSELASLLVATAISAMLAWGAVHLMLASLRFGDTSYGLLAVPLWVPQSSLVLGSTILVCCLARALVITLRAPADEATKSDQSSGTA